LNFWLAWFRVFGFDSDRTDWNFANLQAGIYATTPGITKAKSPKEFLLTFESEKETSGDEIFDRFAIFAAKHNALVKRK
jgi:hypothetical protein